MGKICQLDFELIFKSLGIDGLEMSEISFMNHKQVFGKISEIDEYKRQQYIYMLTSEFNIFSIGRFSVWRPKLMLDDIIHDISVIDNLITKTSYQKSIRQINHRERN